MQLRRHSYGACVWLEIWEGIFFFFFCWGGVGLVYLKLCRGVHGCGVLWVIRMGWESFSKFIYFEIGLQSRVWFWYDCQCGDELLKVNFLILFEIDTYRKAFVADMLVSHTVEEEWSWIYGFNVVLMIGRWSWWGPFFIPWSHRILLLRTEIGWGGVWGRRRIVTCSLFMGLWGDLTLLLFLGKAFGV